MADARRDANSVPTLIGVSNVDGSTPINVYVDPTTHRVLVDLPGGTGSVTTVSVTSANGFAGTVLNPTTTPAISISTTITGIVKGNGTAISAATAGTDYVVGGTQTVGNLLFVDNTYDIGATGATRPKDLYTSGGIAVNTAVATAGIVNVATGFRIANAASSGKLLRANGTNFIASTATYPDTAGTSGNVLTSDGTNWNSSAPTVAIGSQVTGLATGIATFLGTPSSANLIAAVTDETGTGALVFGTNPTIAKPVVNARNQTAQTYTPAGGGTATLDLSLADQHYVTMPAGNATIALSNDTNNQVFIVTITQDSVGSRTVTWFTTIRWAGGVAPTLTTAANKRDVLGFIRTGSGTYDGFVIGQNL